MQRNVAKLFAYNRYHLVVWKCLFLPVSTSLLLTMSWSSCVTSFISQGMNDSSKSKLEYNLVRFSIKMVDEIEKNTLGWFINRHNINSLETSFPLYFLMLWYYSGFSSLCWFLSYIGIIGRHKWTNWNVAGVDNPGWSASKKP